MRYAIAAALLLPLFAGANDGVAGVSAGGIVFRKTDAVAMKKEVLTVSHQLISVDYEFVNESTSEVEETIVFPLPAYPALQKSWDAYYGAPNGFSIRVDGKPVRFRSVVRAFHNGADVTAQLKKLGLSDAQIADHPSFDEASVPPLSAQQEAQLAKLKLYGSDENGQVGSLWDVQVNYVWQQKFPPNRIVRVHHEYRPFYSTGPGEWTMDKDTEKQYCADAAFLKSWNRLARGDEPQWKVLPAAKVSYILKTGNTWKNGIEDFTLNLVKSDPKELVSLCFPGTFRKIDAKTYQVHLRNFRPAQDLEVYFGNISLSDDVDNSGRMPVVPR